MRAHSSHQGHSKAPAGFMTPQTLIFHGLGTEPGLKNTWISTYLYGSIPKTLDRQ